jgi:hypothetical protein
LWSGKSKETAEKMINDMKIMQDELQTKIEENGNNDYQGISFFLLFLEFRVLTYADV